MFITPTNHAMPWVRFEHGQLLVGLLHDIGTALAHRLGRYAIFLSVSSERVRGTLSEGGADGLCYVRPE